MSFAIGFDEINNRDIGYSVPAICDHPECTNEIHRGLSYICCDESIGGGENGCGLFFCKDHSNYRGQCIQCENNKDPFIPKKDKKEWITHKIAHPSWSVWRKENFVKTVNMMLQNDLQNTYFPSFLVEINNEFGYTIFKLIGQILKINLYDSIINKKKYNIIPFSKKLPEFKSEQDSKLFIVFEQSCKFGLIKKIGHSASYYIQPYNNKYYSYHLTKKGYSEFKAFYNLIFEGTNV